MISSAHRKISNHLSKFDNNLTPKIGLLAVIVLLAAIPVTVISIQTYRGITSNAGTGQPTDLRPAFSTNTQTPIFSWHCFCFTTKYRVFLRKGDANFYLGSWYKDASNVGDYSYASFGGWSTINYPAAPTKLDYGGTYYWAVACLGGGCKTSATQAFTVLDPERPKISITSPKPGETVSTATFNFSATVTDNDRVSKVFFYIDSVLVRTFTAAPYSMLVDMSKYSYGPHNFKVIAHDASNGVSTVLLGFYTASPDSDKDGFTDSRENYMGTNATLACGTNAWPPDANSSRTVNSLDLGIFASNKTSIKGFLVKRYDINQDSLVNDLDINIVAGYSGRTCS